MQDLDLVGSAKSGWRMGQEIVSAIFNVILILLRPLALLTQVFFRYRFGERYFTQGTLVGAFVLIFAANALSGMVPPPYPVARVYLLITQTNEFTLPFSFANSVAWMLVGWVFVLAAASWENWFRIRAMHRRGEKWHSRCAGIPRVPGMGNLIQYVVVGLAAICVDLTGASWFAILIAASLAATIVLDRAAARELYNKVLDVLDAEIESETLGAAVKQRLAPKDAHGLYARLPAYINSDTMDRIAMAFDERSTSHAPTYRKQNPSSARPMIA